MGTVLPETYRLVRIGIGMEKVLFTYDMAGMSQRERMAVRRKLFGYTDKSNMGRYSYKREGLLSKMEYECPARCCLLVGKKDAQKLERFFAENSVSCRKYTIIQHQKA